MNVIQEATIRTLLLCGSSYTKLYYSFMSLCHYVMMSLRGAIELLLVQPTGCVGCQKQKRWLRVRGTVRSIEYRSTAEFSFFFLAKRAQVVPRKTSLQVYYRNMCS